MGKKSNLILRNESGVALVIALLMIVILSLIGLASSSSSTFEIKLSGNKRGATDAFYAAEGGVEAPQANTANFSLASYRDLTDGEKDGLPVELKSESPKSRYPHYPYDPENPPPQIFSYPPGVSYDEAPQVTIYHMEIGTPPKALGFSAVNFSFNYYIIDSVGRDQLGADANKSSCEIREKVVRLVPTMQGGY
jgi:type IV pilus assembly protein PilX